MTDYSTLSDAQLQALFQQQSSTPAAPNYAAMSDADLQAAYDKVNPSIGTDLLKTAPAAAGRLAISTAGMPGDIWSFASSAANKIGIPESVQNVAGSVARSFPLGMIAANAPTSADLKTKMEAATGPLYEPQTAPGKILDKGIQFAPGAIGGGGNLATRLLTNVAAPAVAATAAEEAGAGDIGQTAAAVGSSILSHKLVTPKAPRVAITADDLQASAQEKYDAVHKLGLEIKPQPIANLAHQIENKLTNQGLTARNAAPVYEAVGTLKNPPAGAVVTSHNFDNLRKELVQATQSADGSVRKAAGMAIGELDTYLSSIPASHVLKGDAKLAAQWFKEARGDWAAMKRMQMVGGKLDLADLNASTANSGQNIDNTTRQAVKQLIRPDKYGKLPAEKAGFNAEEIAQMRKIARGTSIGNVTRALGNMAGGGLGIGVPIAAGAAAYHFGPEAGALPIAGFGLKKFGNALTARQAGKLEQMVGSRSPLARSLPSPAPSSQQLSASQTALLTAILQQQQLGLPATLGIR